MDAASVSDCKISHQGQNRFQDGVVILEVSRTPISLRRALYGNSTLEMVGATLSEAHCDLQLPCGALTFVRREQYHAVAMLAEKLGLQRRHLIMSFELESTVTRVIHELPGKEKVRIKTRDCKSGLDLHLCVEGINAQFNRSFLDVDVPSSIRSKPRGNRTSSTTDADYFNRGCGLNPRLA